jgi:hypothetical protein
MNKGEIVIYQAPNGETQLEVRLEEDMVWLDQYQIAALFQTDRTSILRHIKNIYNTEELEEKSTCAKIAHVQSEGKRVVTRNIAYYNLDMILSIGYRVNSKNATAFRRWANGVLNDYLVKGYAVNEKMQIEQYNDLKKTIKLLSHVIQNKDISLTADEATGLLQVITDYTYALDTLDKYDYQQLAVEETTESDAFHATYDSAMAAIAQLKQKFGGSSLFAHEKDESFKSSIATIYQTFDGNDLYPSVEEKAAMLLYLVTKD